MARSVLKLMIAWGAPLAFVKPQPKKGLRPVWKDYYSHTRVPVLKNAGIVPAQWCVHGVSL